MAIIVKGTVKIARPIVPSTGLQLWLDASDSTTLFQNSNGTTSATFDGDPIGYWRDKSGNGNNVIQSDGTKKPVLKASVQNSKNSVRCDGVNDNLKSLTGGADSAYSLFVVNTKRGGSGNHMMVLSMGEENNGKRRCLWHNSHFSNGYTSFNGYYADYYSTSVSLMWNTNVANISQLKRNGNTISVAQNANNFTTGTTNNSLIAHTATSIFIGTNNGGSESFNGDYFEILYYNILISDDDRNLILSYLNTKWGIY